MAARNESPITDMSATLHTPIKGGPPPPKKGALDSALDWAGDSWLGKKAGEFGHEFAIGVGGKQDTEKFAKDKRALFNNKYRVGAHALINKQLAEGVKMEDIDLSEFTPADFIAADKEVKGDARKAHATDEAFNAKVAEFEDYQRGELAEKDRLKTKTKAEGVLAQAMKAVASDKKEFLPPPGGHSGGVKADLGGMAGMLASRGNQLATQPLKLTSA